jgi:hypothetical protein
MLGMRQIALGEDGPEGHGRNASIERLSSTSLRGETSFILFFVVVLF